MVLCPLFAKAKDPASRNNCDQIVATHKQAGSALGISTYLSTVQRRPFPFLPLRRDSRVATYIASLRTDSREESGDIFLEPAVWGNYLSAAYQPRWRR